MAVLQDRGKYIPLATPLKIGNMTFPFDAALIGPEGYGDIVIVLSLTDEPEVMIRRRLLAFVTLLDRQNAMKSVTLVLIVRGPIPGALEELEQSCRLILITPSTTLESGLRPLFRLILPNQSKEIESADTVLANELESLSNDAFVLMLLDAARKGPDEVRSVLEDAFDSAIATLLSQEAP